VFETKTGLSGETPYTSPTGVAGYYEYIFSPAFARDGRVEFVAGTTRDITERKRIEAELRAAKEAAAVNSGRRHPVTPPRFSLWPSRVQRMLEQWKGNARGSDWTLVRRVRARAGPYGSSGSFGVESGGRRWYVPCS
jgi:hypothetical protein